MITKVNEMAQAIVTKYLGATNTKSARIQVKSWLGTKYYSYDYAATEPHESAFSEWLNDTNKRLGTGYAKLIEKPYCTPDCFGYVFIIE